MIFRALACDYDATLAWGDVLGPATQAALRRAREAGLALILVTGRTFFEIIRVCRDLELFDAVVAENGAVLYHPRQAMIQDQAPPPPPRLLTELDRRGIPYDVGRVIVGAARGDEARVGEALVAAGVSCHLVYNRAFLMLVPAGISKGTGLRQVAQALGLSLHDVLAMGDAENDLDLFEACAWTACPENAVPELRSRADWVFPGIDGDAIAAAITGPILRGELVCPRSARHRVALGWAAGSAQEIGIPERGVNVLIHGESHSGKSWLGGAMIERLVRRRCAVCVLDPEGDYRVLGDLRGVSRTEVGSVGALDEALGPLDRDPAASVVLDLSTLPHDRKIEMARSALRRVRAWRLRSGRPHWIVLDEAHYLLHAQGIPDADIGIDDDRGFCLVTYRPGDLRESVVRALDILLIARSTVPDDLAFLGRLLERKTGGGRVLTAVPDLARNEFVLAEIGADITRPPLIFTAAPRETTHIRHLGKYAGTRVPGGKAFLFRAGDGVLVGSADSLNDFRRKLRDVEERVVRHHAARNDFSRWVRGAFMDDQLAGALAKAEGRWLREEIGDLRGAIIGAIAARYGPDESAG